MNAINPCSSISRYCQQQSKNACQLKLLTALIPTIVGCALTTMKYLDKKDCQSFLQPSCYKAAQIPNPLDFCMEKISYSNQLSQSPLTYITIMITMVFVYLERKNAHAEVELAQVNGKILSDVDATKAFFSTHFEKLSHHYENQHKFFDRLNNVIKKICCRNSSPFDENQETDRLLSTELKQKSSDVKTINPELIRKYNNLFSEKTNHKKTIDDRIWEIWRGGAIAISIAAIATIMSDSLVRRVNCTEICNLLNMNSTQILPNGEPCLTWTTTGYDNCYDNETNYRLVPVSGTFLLLLSLWTLAIRNLRPCIEAKLTKKLIEKYSEKIEDDFYTHKDGQIPFIAPQISNTQKEGSDNESQPISANLIDSKEQKSPTRTDELHLQVEMSPLEPQN